MKGFKRLVLTLSSCLCLILVLNLAIMHWNVNYLGDNNDGEVKPRRISNREKHSPLVQTKNENVNDVINDKIRIEIEKNNYKNIGETIKGGVKEQSTDRDIQKKESDNNKFSRKVNRKTDDIKINDDKANTVNNGLKKQTKNDVKIMESEKNEISDKVKEKLGKLNDLNKERTIDNLKGVVKDEKKPVTIASRDIVEKNINKENHRRTADKSGRDYQPKAEIRSEKKELHEKKKNEVNEMKGDSTNKGSEKVQKKDKKESQVMNTTKSVTKQDLSIDNELSEKNKKGENKMKVKEESEKNQHKGKEQIKKTTKSVQKQNLSMDDKRGTDDKHENDSTEDDDIDNSSSMKEPTNCISPPHRFFPWCENKRKQVKDMVTKYRTACYTDLHNVTNTPCSLYEYLGNIEQVCVGAKHVYKDFRSAKYATPNYDLNGLLKILANPLYEWMRERISWAWPTWVNAVKTLFSTRRNRKLRYKKKNVFILTGSFLHEPDFFSLAKEGGPVGELVQWADLIAANYILGYNITILKKDELHKYVTLSIKQKNGDICASNKPNKFIDVLYTDITGTVFIESKRGLDGYSKIRCTFRVLDSFGTYTEFNFGHHPFIQDKTVYGDRNLNMPQFLNLFPHTHDNSFLGFIVDNKWKMTENRTAKEDIALVYGKQCKYMKGQQRYLEIVSEYFKLHVTCVDNINNYLSTMPFISVNHGIVSSSRVQELLLKSKVFIGLGFPYEGPGPLEAMAAGTVFLQPRFSPPKNKLNTPFFQQKPTLRLLTSQNPYMEEVVGEPYCFTINVHNSKELRSTLAKIKGMPPLPGKIPKDYTSVGFLERVIVINDKMDFCNPYAPRWPPLRNLIILYGSKGKSCKETCMAKSLFCEHTYFDQINSIKTIEKYSGQKCTSVKKGEFELHSPSYDSRLKTCFVKRGFMFSCMDKSRDVNRICPCRNYEYEQTAICKGCL